MRKLTIIIIALFALASCKSTYDSAAAYDDVYYTPKSTSVVASPSSQSNSSKVFYGGSATSDNYEQTANPQSVAIDNNNYKSYDYVEDTLPPSSADGEYYYVEESDEYYDYDYAARIDRFHNGSASIGYYAPVYTGYYPYYGSSMSVGYGWGMPSSYFSFGFNYGYGGGYYNPWYYNPWYGGYGYGYPYYGYGYGSSYWAGYNQGYYNGYYAGSGGYYPGGGYYPSETYSPGYYYGPRNSRGSSIVGDPGSRGTRVSNDDDNNSEIKNTISSGRGSRVGGGTATGAGESAAVGASTQGLERSNRTLAPNETTSTNGASTRTEKLSRPAQGQTGTESISSQKTSRSTTSEGSEVSRKYAKPMTESVGTTQSSRTVRSSDASPGSTTPGNSRGDVYSRSKKYSKPASETLSGNSNTNAPKRYTSPNSNRPRSSNVYVVPSSRPASSFSTPSRSNNSFNSQSRSSGTYTSPSRSNSSSSSPSRSYSSPSRSSGSYSSPSRSYSSPSRSTNTGSSISPSRSSGSSGSSGTSRSSGSSSGGKRGR